MTDQVTIESKAYGRVAIEERQVLDFPVGLFGFDHLHRYALLDSSQPPFFWLQSMEDVETAFVVVNPYIVVPEYVLDIPEADIVAIGEPAEEELLVFAVVTIAEAERRVSCNLQGPLIIHRRHRIGRQAISLDSRWSVRHILVRREG